MNADSSALQSSSEQPLVDFVFVFFPTSLFSCKVQIKILLCAKR